jgi:hypothetical protein
MGEISIILRDSVHITPEEFKALGRYSCCGNIFTVIHKPKHPPAVMKFKRIEYIFDPEALLMYRLSFNNILAQWNTEWTKELPLYEEFRIQDTLYIRPYYIRH